MDKPRYIFMAIGSRDIFELPLAVADSVVGLARKVGVKPGVIYKAINYRNGSAGKYRFLKVEEPEEEE